MDIGKYRALLRTVEMGNITRAAEELGRLASAQTGVPARCAVKVGKAPAAPAAAAPAQAAEHDKLDDLLAFSRQFDNIIIQE